MKDIASYVIERKKIGGDTFPVLHLHVLLSDGEYITPFGVSAFGEDYETRKRYALRGLKQELAIHYPTAKLVPLKKFAQIVENFKTKAA